MKRYNLKYFLFLAGIAATINVSAQTPGTFSFSCDTDAPNSDYGTKHVLAVWIQNTADPSIFIKTRAKYGNEDDHLTSWISISNKNLVDAVTGATLSSYGTISSEWDGKNVSGDVVPDGDYKIYIEMGWGRNKSEDHAVTSFTFTKSAAEDSRTDAGNNHFSIVSISWVPDATTGLSSEQDPFSHMNIYPNPANEIITVDFRDIPSTEKYNCKIINELGQVIWKQAVDQQYYRIKTGSLGGPGTYYLQVTDGDRNVKAFRTFLVL